VGVRGRRGVRIMVYYVAEIDKEGNNAYRDVVYDEADDGVFRCNRI
jgi:hypothetical protein